MLTEQNTSRHAPPSEDAEEPPSGCAPLNHQGQAKNKTGLFSRLKGIISRSPEKNQDTNLRETLEEYIVEPENGLSDSISLHERVLLSNILKLQNVSVYDVMVPRADIIAIDANTQQDDLFHLLSETHVSRFPVYTDTLDNVIGTVHVKDILGVLAKNEALNVKDMVSEVPIVSPALPILDLVLKMRQSRRHMALVVDEYGGIDGLVTIGDVIEELIGEIEDEHDTQSEPQMIAVSNQTVIADARVDLDEFENNYGNILEDEEREESDTLGGLVFSLAGRIPVRGEIITHSSGMTFEILDAAPRRINRLKISNIPTPDPSAPSHHKE